MNMPIILPIAAIVLASVGALAHAEPVKIRIGWNQTPGHMASLSWHDRTLGYLENHDKTYVADPIRYQGSGQQVAALAADQLDIAAVPPSAFIATIIRAKLNTRIIGDVLHDPCSPKKFSLPFYTRQDASIHSLSDLRGKRIAITARGSANDLIVSGALARGGVKDVEVTRVEMNSGAMPQALKEGKIDVALYLPQFVPSAARDPDIKSAFTGCEVLGPTATVVLIARQEFIAKHRSALVDLMADHMRATRWFLDPRNRAKALKVISDVTKAPESRFADYVFTDNDFPRDPDLYVDPRTVQNTIDISLKFGAIKEGLQVEPTYVDLSVVRDAKMQVDGR